VASAAARPARPARLPEPLTPACWQPPYQKNTCCVRPGVQTWHSDCQTHTAQTDYLRPRASNVSTGDDAAFQDAFFRQGLYNTNTYADCRTTWLGVTVRQPAQDLVILQQIIYRVRPQLVIETGSFRGGFAYYVSTLFHLMGEEGARVLTVDLQGLESWERKLCPGEGTLPPGSVGRLRRDAVWQRHARQLVGSSLAEEVLSSVREELSWLPAGAPVLVTLDSDHNSAFVWEEIKRYAPMVTVGSYLVVQDIILSWTGRDGPMAAGMSLVNADAKVREELGSFIWDRSVEGLGYTGHMYLKRVA